MSNPDQTNSVDIAACEKHGARSSSPKVRLLYSASAIAIVTCLTFAPVSAQVTDNRGKFIVEFSGSVYSGDEQPWNQVLSGNQADTTSFNTIGPAPGLNGMIGYIGPINRFLPSVDNDWNIGVFARFGSSNKQTEAGYASNYYYNILGGNYSTFYSVGNATHREEHLIVDFEARRDVGLGSRNEAQTTLIAGVRFAHFDADTDATFDLLGTYALTQKRRFEFTGVGPKFGIEHEQQLNPYVSFDVSGSAAILYGRRSTDVTTLGDVSGMSNNIRNERSDWVPMLEGRLGFTFSSPNSPTRLSIGVEANAWFDLYDQRAAVTTNGAAIPGNENADRYSYGPYVRLTTLLGEPAKDTFAYSRDNYDMTAPQRQPILEVGLWGGHLWRFGNALNGSGNPRTEIDDFSLGGAEFLAATPFASSWLGQFEAYGEATFNNNRFESMLADNTYGGGHLLGGHLAFVTDSALFGIFGGFGRTEINDNGSDSLDTQYEFGGIEGRFLSTNGSIAIQTGFLNAKANDDNKSLDDAIFARVIGQLFFNDGKTMLQGNLGYAEGLQDSDDFFLPNPTNLFSWGGELEQQLSMNIGSASTSFFVSFEGIRVEESSSAGGTDRVEESTLLAGLKIRFGASTPHERAFNSAPDLPNAMRWLGAVPAVD
ncbi:MAG: hypothetical protein GY761_11070 [Hyphomicrobiales bacterium]|nr:hypothetical protein [Hyphomicrobiales bacterium]